MAGSISAARALAQQQTCCTSLLLSTDRQTDGWTVDRFKTLTIIPVIFVRLLWLPILAFSKITFFHLLQPVFLNFLV